MVSGVISSMDVSLSSPSGPRRTRGQSLMGFSAPERSKERAGRRCIRHGSK